MRNRPHPTKQRPPLPPEAAQQNRLDDEVHARCVAYVRAHACGEVEGLYGPGSLSWEMYREPATLLGGLSAVMLQMAHPAIAAGVSQHSTFAEDLRGRAMRTSTSLYQLVFGTLDDALSITRLLHTMHRRVWGRVEEQGVPGSGEGYRANDQSLLRWVSATVTVAGEQAFEAFVRPLSAAERAGSYQELLTANAAVGLLPETFPPTRHEFEAWYREELRSPALVVGPTARRVADTISKKAILYGPLDELLTAAFLPPEWREAYGFRWDARQQRRFEALKRGLRATARYTPEPYRYVVAWHQASARVQRAQGRETGAFTSAINALGGRWRLPTGLAHAGR